LEIGIITEYDAYIYKEENIKINDSNFTNIFFYEDPYDGYFVFALTLNLKEGPKFYVNTNNNETTLKLRKIVVDYLESHPELDIDIKQFN